MTTGPNQIFRIGSLTLDIGSGRLVGSAGDVDLRPKTFALLATLVRNSGRVVSKDELLSAVWPDVIVTEDSLTQCAHDLRRALGETNAPLLKTVPKRGYLLLTEPHAGATSIETDIEVPPDSIAILPFRSLGPLTERERILFDGLTHDMISGLARMRTFRVTGRGSSFALREFADDPVRLRHMLGVAYVVTGTILPGGSGHRLKLDVVDTDYNHLIWTDEIAVDLSMIHQFAAELLERCVADIATAVTMEERRRSISRRDLPLSAWEAFHCGLDAIFGPEPTVPASNVRRLDSALNYFCESARLGPGFAPAHAFRSFCHYNISHSADRPGRAIAITAAMTAAQDAMTADQAHPASHWAYGRAWYLAGDFEGARRHIGEAIAICPSFPHAHYSIGMVEASAGDPLRALDHLAKCEALSPYDPLLAAVQIARSMAYLRLEDNETAAHWAVRSSSHYDRYDLMQLTAALIFAATGRDAQACLALRGCPDPEAETEKLLLSFPQLDAELRRAFALGLRRISHLEP